MMAVKLRRQKTGSSHRATASAIAILLATLRVGAPLVAIAAAAFWFLNLRSAGTGLVRVHTSVPDADILVGGVMTGYRSDTTLQVPAGRRIVTVRKSGFTSDPEFVVLNVQKRSSHAVSFNLKPVDTATKSDSILPLRPVRQEVFESGERRNLIPPAMVRAERRTVDFVGLRGRETATEQIPPRNNVNSNISVPDSIDNALSATVAGSLVGTEITVSSNPEGSEIWVNGAATNRVTPYTFRGLDRGIYVFTLFRAGYDSNPDSIVVALTHDDQKELVAFELRAKRLAPKPTLEITTTPLAAGIKVNGKSVGIGKSRVELEFGTHRIEFAEVPGFKTPDPVSISLTENQPNGEVSGVYQKNVGNSYLAVVPSSDFGEFDGTQLRVFVDNELLLDSPKERFDGALMGKIAAGKRLVRVEYGGLVNDEHADFVDGRVTQITFRIETFFSKRKLKLKCKTGMLLDEWQARTKALTVLSLS